MICPPVFGGWSDGWWSSESSESSESDSSSISEASYSENIDTANNSEFEEPIRTVFTNVYGDKDGSGIANYDRSDQKILENFKSEYDGAWKLTDKGEKFDQYLADNGVNWFARMVASWMHPIFTFRHTSEKFSFFTNSNTAKISILITILRIF